MTRRQLGHRTNNHPTIPLLAAAEERADRRVEAVARQQPEPQPQKPGAAAPAGDLPAPFLLPGRRGGRAVSGQAGGPLGSQRQEGSALRPPELHGHAAGRAERAGGQGLCTAQAIVRWF